MEEAEATKRRGGEAEDTGGKGTEEVTARRAEKRQKSQRRNHERHREEGRTECRKTLMEHNSPPKEITGAQAMRKTRQVLTKLKRKRKPQEKRRKVKRKKIRK